MNICNHSFRESELLDNPVIWHKCSLKTEAFPIKMTCYGRGEEAGARGGGERGTDGIINRLRSPSGGIEGEVRREGTIVLAHQPTPTQAPPQARVSGEPWAR